LSKVAEAIEILRSLGLPKAQHPDHMIHINGPKFLGPYRPAVE
jgi:hypothetical protein